MPLAVDLYHPQSGKHKRVIIDTMNGDEAALVASRMYPGLSVRNIVPAADAGLPEVRLPVGPAARYRGENIDTELKPGEEVGAGTQLGLSAGVTEVDQASAEPALLAPALKRGPGRPPGAKNKKQNPKQADVAAQIAAEQRELIDG